MSPWLTTERENRFSVVCFETIIGYSCNINAQGKFVKCRITSSKMRSLMCLHFSWSHWIFQQYSYFILYWIVESKLARYVNVNFSVSSVNFNSGFLFSHQNTWADRQMLNNVITRVILSFALILEKQSYSTQNTW